MTGYQLLLVEDDQDDIFFFEEALKNVDTPFNINIIMKGDEVIPFLENCVKMPDVIVMDLNLPRVHGRDLIKKIKSSSTLKNIPIAVLTTSTSKEDVEYCQQWGVEKYITKPNSLDKYDDIIKSILDCCIKDSKKKVNN